MVRGYKATRQVEQNKAASGVDGTKTTELSPQGRYDFLAIISGSFYFIQFVCCNYSICIGINC